MYYLDPYDLALIWTLAGFIEVGADFDMMVAFILEMDTDLLTPDQLLNEFEQYMTEAF